MTTDRREISAVSGCTRIAKPFSYISFHRFLTFLGKIGILDDLSVKTRVFWHSPVLVKLKVP